MDERYLALPRYKQMNKVKHGNLDILKYFSDEFPKKTKHEMNYISIDCHTIKMDGDKEFMQVMMNGYYSENQDFARKFNRTWLLIQDNDGIKITNEQLHLGGVCDGFVHSRN